MKKYLSLTLMLGLVSLFAVDAYSQYCTPSVSYRWGSISKVVTTGASVNINKTTTSNSGYVNYTSVADSVSTGLGKSFNVSITAATKANYSGGLSVWIDWDDNGSFVTSERVYYQGTNGTGVKSFTVNVPLTAKTGSLRMRIGIGYYRYTYACGSSYYGGEYQDYRVYVEPPKARDAEVADLAPRTMCPGLQDINIRLTNKGTDSIASIILKGTIGSTTFGPTTFTGLNVQNNKDTVLKLGTFTFTGGTSYNMKFYSYTVNGATDLNTSNDTLTINNYKTAMSGVYTIGGTTPDFTTFTAAKNALLADGVCGPVTFNVRSGTYTEQVDFNAAISGASGTNNVRFRPDPANTASVTLKYNSNYTIGFSGGISHVSFDSLNLETSGSANVVQLYGTNDSISLDGNNFLGYNTTSTSTSLAVVSDKSSSNNTTNFEFVNNSVKYGSAGVSLYGQSTSKASNQSGFVIKNNTFTDIGYFIIYTQYCKNGIIEGNTGSNKTNSSSGYGIYGYYNNDVDVIGNNIVIYGSSWAKTLYWNRCYGTSGNRALIANNMFSRPNNSTSSISYDYLYYSNYNDVVYNSWYGKFGYNSSSYGLIRVYYGTQLNFSNNNVFNDGANGYAAKFYGNPTTEKNNNYYNSIATKRRYPSSGGTNTLYVNPGYKSTTDLHAGAVAIYKKGSVFTGVTKDIDGDTRNSTNPCIGADEFTIPGRDAAPTEVVYSPACPGTETIKVRVENKGLDTLSSFKVDWSVATNGGTPAAKSQISWSGTLYPGMDTVLTLGNLTLSGAAKYGIKAITSAPNASTDEKVANDTVYREIETAMTGTFTVGGLSPDFTTVSDASAALVQKGVCGPVVFDIRPGSYVGQMKLGVITGSNSTNSITWRGTSVSNTTLSYQGTYTNQAYATVDLDGTNYMIFKNLKITNTYTGSYATAIRLHNNSNYITIDSCELSTSSTGSSYGLLGSSQYYGTSNSLNSNITVTNSLIKGVGEGIRLNGTSNSVRSKNLKIENNTFKDINYNGIYIYYYCDSVQVNNNDLSDFGGTGYGAYYYYVRNLVMEGNEIVAKSNYALYLNRMNYSGATSASTCRVANNMISQTGTSYGVYTQYANYLDFYHNSVRAEGNRAFYEYYGSSKDFRNNIFYSGNNYAFYRASSSTSYISTMNNNLYYRGNSTSIAYDGGTRTLASWKSYHSAWNSNSKVGDPKFKAKDDLRIANGKLADSLALTGLGVTVDIDGETRSTTNPDAGADEYDYQPIDGNLAVLTRPTGMCLTATDTLEFGVVNVGGDTIKLGTNGVNIAWSVSGPSTASGTDAANSGSVAPGDTVFIKTANSVINLSKPGKYTVTAYITSTWDKYNENDTLVLELNRIATESLTALKDTTVYYKDSLDVTANSVYKGAEVVLSELCQYNSSTGRPLPNRPSWLVADDYIELSTGKPNVNLAGYKVEMYSNNATTPSLTAIVPTGATTNSNGTMILAGGTGTSAANAYYALGYSADYWSSASAVGYILKDPSGNIVDVAAANNASFNASTGVTSAHWSGNVAYSGSTQGIRRDKPDDNTASNWSVSSNSNRQNPATLNAGMNLSTFDPIALKWTYNSNVIDTVKTTQAGPWTAKGTKLYIASLVSTCTGDTIKDTASIVAFSTNLVLSGNTPQYYSYPLSQTSGIGFSGSVKNLGDSMSNVRVYAQIGGSAAGDSLASNGLARFANANYTIDNGASITSSGNKTITYYLSTTDDFPNDDTVKTMTNVSDSVMARENGNLPLNINASSFNSFGQRFSVYSKDSITGAMAYIKTAFPGDKFKFELYKLNGNTVGAMLNESNEITLTSLSDTGMKSMRFKCLSVLDTGDYMLSVKKTSTVFSSGFGANQMNAIANTAYGHNGSSWTSVTVGGNSFNYGIRMVFGSYDFPTFASVAPACISGSKFALSGGAPSGGSYFGTGVSGDSLNPTALSVGSNTIYYTVANSLGCPDTVPSTIDVKAEPTVSSTFTQLTSCVTNNASISVTASNGFGTFSYSNNGGTSYQSTGTFSTLGSGSYTVMVKDSVCTVTDSTYVAAPPGAPNKPTASGGATYCKGDVLNKIKVSSNTSGTAGVFKWYKDGSLTQSHGTGDSIAPTDTIMTQVYYVIEDRLGCVSAADTTTVTVNALPVVSNTALSNICTNNDTIVLSTGTPSGGNYSGTGVISGVFKPLSAGAGTHVITYSYTDANNCSNSDTASVTVYQAPVVSLASLDSNCTNTPKYNLTGGSPTGGTYSGFGVSSGQFDPNVSGQGLHTIEYKVSNTHCADSASASLRIHTYTTTSVTSLSNRCLNAGTLTLSNGSPTGGVYTGTGVTSGIFNPMTAGVGSHTINYVYTDNNKCQDSANTNIQVDSLPVITYTSLTSVCKNTPKFGYTQASATPTGGTGTYFGTGITSGLDFDANTAGVGTHSIGYAYVDGNGCRDTATQNQVVDSVPNVAWTSTLNAVCNDAAQFPLVGGLPAGGVYSGKGVQSGNAFNADSAGVGTHAINYVFTDGNGCKDSTSQSQKVNPLPTVSISLPANWCLNATAIKLSSGRPMGGTYTVNGVVDSVYSVKVSKMDTVVYSYTDSNTCKNTAMAAIKSDTVPVVTFASIASSCIGYKDFTLTQGSPAGGIYSGNNVNGGKVYNPVMVTTDTLIYSFVDSNRCADSASTIMTVNALPVVAISTQADVCENTPMFAMSGGTPAGGVYSGGGVSSGNYTASTFGTGTDNITYVYTDSNNCIDSAITPLEVNKVTKAGMNWLGYTCNNTPSTDISAQGIPKGGVFSGTGVSSNNFDATVAGTGTHNLKYVFTNLSNCMDSIQGDIIVEAAPVFNIVGDVKGCGKQGILMSTDLPGKTYKWNNGLTTDTVRIHQNGMIWVKVTDASTQELCSSRDTVTVEYAAVCVGIDEQLTSTSVNYFPNPNNGSFNYELNGFEGMDIDVSIQAMSGQVIYEKTWTNVSALYQGQINVDVVESGVYFINLKTEKGSVMHRITINK